MPPLRIGILGASGETGGSIVNALLEDGSFNIIALTRPSSMTKPANRALAERGVTLRECDLSGLQDDLVDSLKDIQILVSSIGPMEQLAQIPLATAANLAGVQRFLPCAFMTVCPPGGIHVLRDEKEKVYNHIFALYLPYTIIDVGWWYQISVPALPSGRTDYAILMTKNEIPGHGNVASALTDLRDIGRYVAKVVTDERTVNKFVFVYNELWSQNQIYEFFEKITGEKLARTYISKDGLQAKIDAAGGVTDYGSMVQKVSAQYEMSWGIRGDNQPEYAKYLGYLTSKELYPDLKYRTFEEYAQEVLDGKAREFYPEVREKVRALNQKSV